MKKCFIENYEDRPKKLDLICNKYEEIAASEGLTYQDCANWKLEVSKIGYSLDYGLDADPYDLFKI